MKTQDIDHGKHPMTDHIAPGRFPEGFEHGERFTGSYEFFGANCRSLQSIKNNS
jgi:hypothetical protein